MPPERFRGLSRDPRLAGFQGRCSNLFGLPGRAGTAPPRGRSRPDLETQRAEDVGFVPSIVAIARKITHQGSVVVINVFLGWTFIGWVIALAMACRTNRVVRD